MRIVAFLLVLLAACVQPTSARDFSAAERSTLTGQIARFEAALKDDDFDTVGKTVPPKILESIASGAGVSVETLRSALKTQMQMALASVKLIEFGMDMGAARFEQTPDGTPYALIPTRTLMETDGQKIEAKSHTLALIDGGEWYLLRVTDQQQVTILRKVYPAFATVQFPEGSVQPVE